MSAILALLLTASPATWSESKVGTHFQIYVPPNNLSGTRASSITITAQAGTSGNPVLVNLVDDGADGDTDDSVLGASLLKGDSLVRYIKDGAVNDDGGGKWDGDYFIISASQPVSVSITTDSDWQHDWAPADNGLLRGQRFFLYTTGTSVSNRDLDVFAYAPDTRVEVFDVTATALGAGVSGIARVGPRGARLLSVDLAEGEDTLRTFGLGRDLCAPGRTYELVATRPVTVMFGALDSVVPQNQARDGAGYVPGAGGTAQDTLFYFSVPHNPGLTNEQEIRIVAADPSAQVRLDGWADGGWTSLGEWSLSFGQHADVVGPALKRFRLTSDGGRVDVYEANWMETGAFGTSDESDFVPAQFNADGTATWIAYLGPPGDQNATSLRMLATHLYLFSLTGAAGVTIRDVDTGGTLFSRTVDVPAGGYVDVAVSSAVWSTLNRPAQGIRPYLRVDAPGPLAVNMANWNDNWMAFSTSVLPRNPVVELSSPEQLTTGTTATFTGVISNVGLEPLTDLDVNLTLGAGLQLLSASLGDAGPTSQSTTDAGVTVRFTVANLPVDTSLALSATAVVTADVSGRVLPVDISVTGSNGSVVIGAAGSAPARVENPAVATLTGLTVRNTETVALTWTEEAPLGVVSSLWVERASSLSGPWVTVSPVEPHVGTGAQVAAGFTDTTVVTGANVYYRVQATGQGGATAQLGPVLAQPRDVTPPPVPTLSVAAGDRQVALTFGGSSVADLSGYFLERARTGSTAWTRVNAAALAGPARNDTGLSNGVSYLYRAIAVDLSGNQSAPSAPQLAIPSAASSRVSDLLLGYEDMLGAGENDWDYNDFLVRVVATQTMTGELQTAVQLDYEPLARGAGYVHSFRQALPVPEGVSWSATVTVFAAGAPATVYSTTTTTGTGPLDVEIYADTRVALPPSSGAYTNTPRGGTFVAGRTARLVVTFGAATSIPDAAPWDAYLRLPYLPTPNEIHRESVGGQHERTARGPLAENELPFVEEWSTGATPTWPCEGVSIWSGYEAWAPWWSSRDARYRDWPAGPNRNVTFSR